MVRRRFTVEKVVSDAIAKKRASDLDEGVRRAVAAVFEAFPHADRVTVGWLVVDAGAAAVAGAKDRLTAATGLQARAGRLAPDLAPDLKAAALSEADVVFGEKAA